MKKKNMIVVILCLLFSVISGIIANDVLIGGIALFTGLLCAYYASIGKRCNYVYGLINYLVIGIVAYQNHLYGLFWFYLLIFSPLQIKGFLSWNENLDEDNSVKAREFTLKNSIIIVASCLLGSMILGYLLSLIPSQRLAFMDATSNIINLCGVILMILRFKESWWLWLFNNIIDLSIWLITFLQQGKGSFMMFLMSVGYLLINVYGIIKWNKNAKNEKK